MTRRPPRAWLARVSLYAALILGSIVMALPFLWMIITSFQTSQESLQAEPVWLPHRLNPVNWNAARALGTQGGDAWWGGVAAGREIKFELRIKGKSILEVGTISGTQDTSSGFLFGASETKADSKQLSFTQQTLGNNEVLYVITVKNTGDRLEARVPLRVTFEELSLESSPISSPLPADRVSMTNRGPVLEWNNIAPGLLGYALENYRDALQAAPFGRYFLNSTIIAAAQVILGLIVVTLAAFAFAKIPFWGRDVVFAAILSSLVIPGEMLLVPNFLTVTRLSWMDSYQGMVVPWIASVFGIFLLRQFFLSLPNELFEAARIDGAGYGVQLTRVALPLAVPGLVTFGIFSFLGSWNALLWPLLVTNQVEMRTLQVGLRSFIGEAGTNYGQLMAASLMVITPIIIGFLFAQKQFIAGVARSGLK